MSLESHVILAHHETINSGKVHYNMLSHIDDLFTALEREATKLDIVYGGDQPLPPLEIVVALKGVPPNVPMDDLQMTYFEQITTDYLAQQLLSISPFPVLSAKVKSQRGPSFVQRVRRGLQEQDTGDDWIEVTTHVLGSYTPPLDTTVKLDDIVNDAFKYGKDAFIEDVKTGPSRPGSILQGEQGIFFAGVSNANFRLASETVYAKASVNGNSAISMDAGDGNSKLISLCVGLIAVMSMWIGFVVYRMRKADDNSIVSTKSGKDKEKENLDNNYGMKLNEPTKSSKAVDGIKAQTKKKKPTSKVSISPDTFDATSGFHDDALPNDLEVDVLSGSETSSKRIKSGRDIKVSGQNKSTHSSGTVAADDIKNTDLVGVKGNRSRSFKNRGKSDAISEPEQTHSSEKSRPAPVNYQAAFAAVGMAQDPDRESALSSRSKGSNRSGSPKTNKSNLGLANERTSNHADLVDDDEKSMNNKESPKQEDKTTVTQSVDKALSKSRSGRSMHNRSSQDSTTVTQSVDKALSKSHSGRSMHNRSSQDSTTATQSVDKALSKSHSGRSMHNRSSQGSTTATQSVDKALSKSRSMHNRSSHDSTTATQSVDNAASKSRSMHSRSSHNDEQPSSRSRSPPPSKSKTLSTPSVTFSSNPEGLLSSTDETSHSKSSRALRQKPPNSPV